MRGRSGRSSAGSPPARSVIPARPAASSCSATTCSRIGSAFVRPSETISCPLSSSARNRISSIRVPACSTSARACSSRAGTSAPSSSAESRSAMIRASGVRSSCDTAAVKPMRSSAKGSFTGSSPLRHELHAAHGSIVGGVAKILIVEDDAVIADGMARHLSAAGFEPLVVGRGELGLARLRFESPDVSVLDGWRLIETARAEGIGTPIVVVSARGTEHDRVHALEIGADDYLVKPFSMRELVARVAAAARRGVRPAEERRGEAIEIEELRIDPREVQAYVDGTSAELTPTEFKLLYTLALDRGRVVTRDELLQKVDRVAPRHSFIQTRFGVGYKLEAEPK